MLHATHAGFITFINPSPDLLVDPVQKFSLKYAWLSYAVKYRKPKLTLAFQHEASLQLSEYSLTGFK